MNVSYASVTYARVGFNTPISSDTFFTRLKKLSELAAGILLSMPTYEFACLDCGARTDVRASIEQLEEGLDARCQSCDGSSLRRLLSTAAVVRRGAVPAPAGGGGGACCAAGCACGAN